MFFFKTKKAWKFAFPNLLYTYLVTNSCLPYMSILYNLRYFVNKKKGSCIISLLIYVIIYIQSEGIKFLPPHLHCSLGSSKSTENSLPQSAHLTIDIILISSFSCILVLHSLLSHVFAYKSCNA